MTSAASRPSRWGGSRPGSLPSDEHGSEHAGQHAGTASEARTASEPAAPTLERLVREQLDFIWRLLRRLGLDEADAQDAAQQVLLIAASKLEEIQPGKERTFLYGIALRVASNARRGARRRARVDRENGALAAARCLAGGNVPWPDELAELARAQALLDQLLAALPEELARVLVLAEIEQCTTPEIAELEGIPVGTAASRLRRARSAFQELLRLRSRSPSSEEER
ncbi:MAG: hypothetical protein RL033_1384 [Pseudomonadota bacterium]